MQLSHLQVLHLGPTLAGRFAACPCRRKMVSVRPVLQPLSSTALSGCRHWPRKGSWCRFPHCFSRSGWAGLELVFFLPRETLVCPHPCPTVGKACPRTAHLCKGANSDSAQGWASFRGLERAVSKEHYKTKLLSPKVVKESWGLLSTPLLSTLTAVVKKCTFKESISTRI